jgi:peroxiredoxin
VITRKYLQRFLGAKNNFVVRMCAAALFLLAIWMVSILRQSGSLLPEGTLAPDWRLPLVGQQSATLGLEDLKGQVVVLDFWALSCPPCLRQIGILEDIYRHLGSQGMEVVGVVIKEGSVEEIRDYVAKRNPGYKMVVDIGDVAKAYEAFALPTLYIIDRKGRVATAHCGLWDYESLASAVGRAVDQ